MYNARPWASHAFEGVVHLREVTQPYTGQNFMTVFTPSILLLSFIPTCSSAFKMTLTDNSTLPQVNFQTWRSPEDSLAAIFEAIRDNGHTLRSFLLAAFESGNAAVKMFYGNNGPAAIIRCWDQKLYSTLNHTTFVTAAADVTIRRSRRELDVLKQAGLLRHPAKTVCQKRIDEFSLGYIRHQLKTSGPTLFRLLNGLTDESPTFVSTLGSMLLFHHSQQSNYLQTMMGLYLYSLGCPKRVLTLLNAIGLSVSHTSICTALKTLTDDALKRVKAAVRSQHWFLIYDNINFWRKKSHQRLDNADAIENGTTATIIIGEDLGKEVPPQSQRKPSLEDVTDTNDKHFVKFSSYHLLGILVRRLESFRPYAMSPPTIRTLATKETISFPLPAMHIDQSTLEGNLQSIQKIMREVLELPEDWFDDERRILVGGDMLTINRVRGLQKVLGLDESRFLRFLWAEPVMQLFHLQMNLCSAILRAHYGNISTPGSMAFNIARLNRKRLKPDMPCYYTAVEFLRNIYEAMVTRVWEVELDVDKLDEVETKLSAEHTKDSMRACLHKRVGGIVDKYLVSKPMLTTTFANANVNAALFIRDMTIFIELCDSIKKGDVGRIEEVLKIVTIMFQSGKTRNYGTELLRVNYAIHHVWSEQRKNAIFSSWLVNNRGEANSWLPADLYQEHNNLLTKTIHSAKGSSMTWETLAQSISTNIRMFSTIASKIESQYETPRNSTFHSVVSAEIDVQTILQSLRAYDILGKNPRPDGLNVPLVVDLVDDGMENLVSGGRYQRFLDNTDDDRDAMMEDLEKEFRDAQEYIQECLEQ